MDERRLQAGPRTTTALGLVEIVVILLPGGKGLQRERFATSLGQPAMR